MALPSLAPEVTIASVGLGHSHCMRFALMLTSLSRISQGFGFSSYCAMTISSRRACVNSPRNPM